jgi:hypothetical protein
MAQIVLYVVSSNVSPVKACIHAIVTSVGFHGASTVSSIIPQFSISHRVGTRGLKNIVVPEISKGILKSVTTDNAEFPCFISWVVRHRQAI